ncbi:odorant receptor 13a-like [Vespula squamosa]|uniref:Odorant receptor 13a-like n=1 Tax=Vespula squamosa TaxID=30214 RepID=A0ABD2BSS0_VESSQ
MGQRYFSHNQYSTNLCDAIYHCDWYELSMINLKFLCICMVRARQPLQLTCEVLSCVLVHIYRSVLSAPIRTARKNLKC